MTQKRSLNKFTNLTLAEAVNNLELSDINKKKNIFTRALFQAFSKKLNIALNTDQQVPKKTLKIFAENLLQKEDLFLGVELSISGIVLTLGVASAVLAIPTGGATAIPAAILTFFGLGIAAASCIPAIGKDIPGKIIKGLDECEKNQTIKFDNKIKQEIEAQKNIIYLLSHLRNAVHQIADIYQFQIAAIKSSDDIKQFAMVGALRMYQGIINNLQKNKKANFDANTLIEYVTQVSSKKKFKITTINNKEEWNVNSMYSKPGIILTDYKLNNGQLDCNSTYYSSKSKSLLTSKNRPSKYGYRKKIPSEDISALIRNKKLIQQEISKVSKHSKYEPRYIKIGSEIIKDYINKNANKNKKTDVNSHVKALLKNRKSDLQISFQGNLHQVKLDGLDFSRANLSKSKINAASAKNCNFNQCIFESARLEGDFSEANFIESEFFNSNLSNSIFYKVNFSQSKFYMVNMGNVKCDLNTQITDSKMTAVTDCEMSMISCKGFQVRINGKLKKGNITNLKDGNKLTKVVSLLECFAENFRKSLKDIQLDMLKCESRIDKNKKHIANLEKKLNLKINDVLKKIDDNKYITKSNDLDFISPVNFFVGREKEKIKIKNCLESKKYLVMYGMSGIGKTQVALSYFQDNRKLYKDILLLDVRNEDEFIKSCQKIIKLKKLGVQGEKLSLDDAWSILKNSLNSHECTLVVLENASKLSETYQLINKKILDGTRCHVLINSTNGLNWQNIVTYPLETMNQEDCIKLIKKLSIQLSNKKIKRLLKHLGYFPLLITQSMAYLSKVKTIDNLLTAETIGHMKKNSSLVESEYKEIFSSIVKDIINDIGNKHSKISDILRIISLMSYNEITYQLTEVICNKISVKVSYLKCVLLEYGIFYSDFYENINIHSAFLDEVRADKGTLRKHREQAIDIVNDVFNYHWTFKNNSNAIAMFGNAVKLVEYLEKKLHLTEESYCIKLRDLRKKIANYYLWHRGDMKKALNYYNFFLNKEKCKYNTNDEFIAGVYHSLGNTYAEQHKYVMALDNYEKAYGIRIKIFEKDNKNAEKILDLTKTINQLGHLMIQTDSINGYVCSIKKAEEFFNFALKKRLQLKKNGKFKNRINAYINHTKEGLAECYFKQGNYNKSVEVFKGVIKKKGECFGENHAETAYSQMLLGKVYYQRNEFNKAHEILSIAKEKQVNYYSNPLHREIMITKGALALVNKKLNNHKSLNSKNKLAKNNSLLWNKRFKDDEKSSDENLFKKHSSI